MLGAIDSTTSLLNHTRSEQQTRKASQLCPSWPSKLEANTNHSLTRKLCTSRRFSLETLCSRNAISRHKFASLAAYLLQPYEKHNAALPSGSVNAKDAVSDTSFVTLYSFGNQGDDEVVHFTDPTQLDDLDLEAHTDLKGRLLFIRGNVAPEWLSVIGGKFRLDPEFFQRHLDFKCIVGRPNYFTLPALPSAASSMTRLRLNTIGYIMRHHTNRGWLEQADLDATRQRAERTWASYLEKLSRGRERGSRSGDSIVRDFSVHNHDHFSLEQDLSVNITFTGEEWLGRDLTLSSQDPWSSDVFQVDPLAISFYPTFQQRDHVALHRKSYTNKVSAPEGDSNPARILQTASLLHLEYARRLDKHAARSGPLFVLFDVLRLSASSEVQLLNMIETKINMELSPAQFQALNEPTLSNLLYHKRILRRHLQRLLENRKFIKYQASAYPVDGAQPNLVNYSKSKLNALIQDFDYLVDKAKNLSSECDRGMNIMMNQASIKEAQKAIVQAEGITKLTKLAFVFVPISFTCSFFGMNFSQFSSGCDLDLWIWVAVSVPILSLSILFMNWDVSQAVRRLLRKWCGLWGFFGQRLDASESRRAKQESGV